MRVLIQPVGSSGDVHPFVGLGAGLRRRGHDVTIFTNDLFEELVEDAGLEFVATGSAENFEEVVHDPDLWHPRKGLAIVLDLVLSDTEKTIERLLPHAGEPDTVLVGSTLGFASRIVRDLREVPLVTAHLAPSAFRSNINPPKLKGLWLPDWTPRWHKRLAWWLVDKVVDRFMPRLHGILEKYGLPPERRVFHDWIHSPDAVVGLFPEWFAMRPPDWPSRFELTGFPLFDESTVRAEDSDLDAWLDAGDPPIVFTAGSANFTGGEFFRRSAKACASLGRRGLLLTRAEAALPDPLPEGIRHEEYAPFSRVFPRAAALVSHGGIGTCAQAFAAGTPHLVAAMAFDQFDNGTRVRELRAGDLLGMARYTVDRATKALERILTSSEIAEGCEGWREKAKGAAWVDRTCEIIEETRAG